MIFMNYVLDLSPSEVRGIKWLIIIFLAVDAAWMIFPSIPYGEQRAAELNHYIIELEAEASVPPEPVSPFMPDTVSSEQLVRWGWPRSLAGNLESYRAKAGTFRNEGQIRGLYGMTDSLFENIQPYLRFKAIDRQVVRDTVRRKFNRRCPDPMDINMADSLMLLRLHGIGPVLAGRIIGYREILGGYVDLEQLTEVYGLPEETRDHILPQLYVDNSFAPRKININAAEYGELYRHPYLKSRQAVALIRYRQQHGIIGTVEEIKRNPIFSEADLKRLMPYLPFTDSLLFQR